MSEVAARTRWLVRYGWGATFTTLGICLVALLGWATGSPPLKQFLPGTVSMKANTAAAGVVLAGALILLHGGRRPAHRRATQALAALVLLLGGLTLLEWVLGMDLRIDEALFREVPSPIATAAPGRMSILTASVFTLLALAVLLRTSAAPRARAVATVLAASTAVVGFAVTLGYAYGTSLFATLPSFTPVAFPTGLVIFLTSTALLATDMGGPVAKSLSASTPGGALLRSLGPAVIFVPFILGGAIGLAVDLLDIKTLLALAVTAGIVAMFAILWIVTGRLDRIDAARRRAEADLSVRVRDLQVRTDELGSFSYSLSHDLRGPLRAMDGFSKMLIDEHGGQLDAQGLADLRRVREATQRMGQIIDDLLSLTRMTRTELGLRNVDVSACASEIIHQLRARDPERNVVITVEPGIHTTADPELLDVVLSHLLDNAWKFTSRREEARIEVGHLPTLRGPAIFVKDNGVGFDPQFAGKLFNPFQRLHAPKEYPGTGIGLATVARIVQRHGGSAWAEGGVGKGATFYFTLGPEGHP